MQRSLQQCLELAEVLEAQNELLLEVNILALHAADKKGMSASSRHRMPSWQPQSAKDGGVTLGGVC